MVGLKDSKRIEFTGFTLKIIAICAMTCDHVGAIFFPNNIWLRVIGRLTMSIMSFLIAEGFLHTRSVPRYLRRLLIFAAISEIPYWLAFGYFGNVMWTLSLGLLALWLMQRWPDWRQGFVMLAALLLSIPLDWPFLGVFMVVGFAKIHDLRFRAGFIAFIAVLALLMNFADGVTPWDFLHLGILSSIPLLLCYNGQRGHDARYLFYVFYPAHMAVLYIINLII